MIIDSIIAHFRNEFSGRGELAERQQRLAKHLSEIIRVASEYNIAVVIINQVMADPGAMAMFGPSIKPVGGHILAHASTTRVHLKKGRDPNRPASPRFLTRRRSPKPRRASPSPKAASTTPRPETESS